MKLAVDGLTNEDWNMGRDPKTNGKRYVEWETNLMGEQGKLQTWIEKGRRTGVASPARQAVAFMPQPMNAAQRAQAQRSAER